MLYDTDKYPKRRNQSQFMDRFTGRDVQEDYPYDRSGPKYRPTAFPAVNIVEYDKDYRIELASPGLCKKDYDIELDNDVLRIASNKKKVDEDTSARYSRQEFGYREFEKAFILPDNADREEISASCNDGILAIHIPKKIIESRPKSRIIKVK
ncbi:MAG: Hsp20/alpha crystallin family protein [Candidatus Cyclobacteriaceae bacterium M2_1C_046]